MIVASPLEPDIFLDDIFSDLLDSLAPNAGDLLMLIKSYFDESYDDNLLCVAGYVFNSRNARRLDLEWKKMLFRYRLPYFRMSACNAHKEPFEHLTPEECVLAATEAIRIINAYAAFGCSVTIDQKAFNKIITPKGVVSTPYELCSWFLLVAARAEIVKFIKPGPMAFFFESGFRDQRAANRMMNNIFNSPELRSYYNYLSHTFIDKEKCRGTQAADLLAWQWYKNKTRLLNGIVKPRGDLAALMNGSTHWALDIDAKMMQEMVDEINAKAGTPIGNEMAGIAVRNPSSPLFPKRPGELGSAAAYEELKRQYPERF